jgi:hypothetical protein
VKREVPVKTANSLDFGIVVSRGVKNSSSAFATSTGQSIEASVKQHSKVSDEPRLRQLCEHDERLTSSNLVVALVLVLYGREQVRKRGATDELIASERANDHVLTTQQPSKHEKKPCECELIAVP